MPEILTGDDDHDEIQVEIDENGNVELCKRDLWSDIGGLDYFCLSHQQMLRLVALWQKGR